jgi:hypothetical protein
MREKGAKTPEMDFHSASTLSSEARERIKRRLSGDNPVKNSDL